MTHNSTPSELLAGFLLGGDTRARAAADDIGKQRLWDNQIRLALNWCALPPLRSRIAALEVDLEIDARKTLAELSASTTAQSALIAHGTARALAALEDAGIRVAAFKGLGMIASLYQRPSERMLSDADVLIESRSFRAAVPVLARIGFFPDVSIPLDEWLDLLEQRVYPVHDFLDFADGGGSRIDLHWRMRTPSPSGFPIAEIVGRAESRIFSGIGVRAVAPEDAILFTTHHLVRDKLAPRSAVKDLLDLKAWLEVRDRRWKSDVLLRRAGSTGLTTSLLAALEILSRYDPDGGSQELAREIADASTAHVRKTAARLADVFALQLRRPMSDVVVGLTAITPSLARRFIVSRLRSITDPTYKSHKFAGDSAVPFSAAARAVWRDLLRLTPRRLALYRTLGTETRAYLGDESG
jgi:hypothetical protein